MTQTEYKDSVERLARAVVARETVDDLYAQAFAPGVRALHRALESLPLSMIPATLAWTFVAITLLETASPYSLQVYLAGLFLLAVGALALAGAVRLHGRRALPDAVLERLGEDLAGLAYYPNVQLKDRIREKGYASRWDFYLWYLEQASILATRIRDLNAQRTRSLAAPVPSATVRSEAARRFLQS
jgi:hypothetical protein